MALRFIPPPPDQLYYYYSFSEPAAYNGTLHTFFSSAGTSSSSPQYSQFAQVGWINSGNPDNPVSVPGVFDYAQKGSTFVLGIPNGFGPTGYPTSAFFSSFGGWFRAAPGETFDIMNRYVGAGLNGQLLVRKQADGTVGVSGYTSGHYMFPANDPGSGYGLQIVGNYPDDSLWHHIVCVISNGPDPATFLLIIDGIEQTLITGGRTGAWFSNDNIPSTLGACTHSSTVEFSDQFLYLRDLSITPSDILTLMVGRQLDNPTPVVSFYLDSQFHIQATGTVSSPGGRFVTWFEVTPSPFSGDQTIRMGVGFSDFGTVVDVSGGFPIPYGENWDGAQIRFVISPVDNPLQVFRSDSQYMNGSEYDNRSLAPTYEDPVPSVVSFTVDANFRVTATANAGPSDAPSFYTWWEITLVTGVVVRAGMRSGDSYGSNQDHVDNFYVPDGQNWNGLDVTFNMESPDATQRWQSSPFTLANTGFNRHGFIPPPPPPFYAGALMPQADPTPLYGFNLFQETEVDITIPTVYAPTPSVSVTASIDNKSRNLQLIAADLAPGLYQIEYVSGALFFGGNYLWNYYDNTYVGEKLGGLFLQSGDDAPYYVLQAPMFIPNGYASEGDAETAAVGFAALILHTGGNLYALTDYASTVTPNSGAIGLSITSISSEALGTGEWTLARTTMVPSPTVINPTETTPKIRGLSPGVAVFRYTLNAGDHKARHQDFEIRVWDNKTGSGFPAVPEAGTPYYEVGWGGTIRQRTPRYVPPKA